MTLLEQMLKALEVIEARRDCACFDVTGRCAACLEAFDKVTAAIAAAKGTP